MAAVTTEASVQKWGNGLAIRITKPVARALGVLEGTRLVMHADPGMLVVEPVAKRMTLEERLARFDPALHGGEEMAFAPVGNEM